MLKTRIYVAKVSLWDNFFWFADYESDLRFVELIWRIQDCCRKLKKLSYYAENLYTKVFCIAD